MKRLLVPVISIVVLLATTAVALAAVGDLVQKAPNNGCLSLDGTNGVDPGIVCQVADKLVEPSDIVVSPDGKHVYAGLDEGDGVLVLRRNADATLTQIGCIANVPVVPCVDGRALNQVRALAISPDGEHIYAAAANDDAVAVLDRDPTTGLLSQDPTAVGCISNDGVPDCFNGRALSNVEDVVISPDGSQVYGAGDDDNAVAVLDRTAGTGALTQDALAPGCVADNGALLPCVDGDQLLAVDSLAISPDGASVYVNSTDDDAVAVLDRVTAAGATKGNLSQKAGTDGCVSNDGSAGACEDGRGLGGPSDIRVSPDGNSVYVTGTADFLAVLDRSDSGNLEQKPGPAGCFADDGPDDGCTEGFGLDQVLHLEISPDGRSVYTGSGVDNSMALFDRDPSSGALTQKPAPLACFNLLADNGCSAGIGLIEPSIAVSPDNKTVYSAAEENLGVIGVFDREPVTADPGPGPDPDPDPAPVTCDGKVATHVGTDDPETIKGTKKSDVIAALGGKDKVIAGGGNDRVCGGDGNDNLNGSKGKDRLFGEAGKDKLNGSGGKGDFCNGGAGKDKAAGSCEKERSA